MKEKKITTICTVTMIMTLTWIDTEYKEQRKTIGKRIPKCMNCNCELDDDARGLYAKRFCSDRCRSEYMLP